MDVLLPAIGDAFDGDSTLTGLTESVRYHSHPSAPAKLSKPGLVYRLDDGVDESGLHGAAVNVDVEVSVWGYRDEMIPACWETAQRVSEIMISGISVPGSGTHLRFGEFAGWQDVDQPDREVVLLRATFRARYWSAGRISALQG